MSIFSESSLERKLSELNQSAQSIQQLSTWIIRHHKHCQMVVKLWQRALVLAPTSRKLTYLYLANDVVQNARKKHPEYPREFGSVLRQRKGGAMAHLAQIEFDDKTVQAIQRLLGIWKDRAIFEARVQADMAKIWAARGQKKEDSDDEDDDDGMDSPRTPPLPEALVQEQKISLKRKKDSPTKQKRKVRVSFSSSTGTRTPPIVVSAAVPSDDDDDDEPAASAAAKNGSGSDDDQSAEILQSLLSPSNSPTTTGANADPPEAEELITALQDLENTASSDAIVREKIAQLPSEVSEEQQLTDLKNPEQGRCLMTKVDDASLLLTDYNERLQQELRDRKKVSKMIRDFLVAQKDLEAQAEERLEQYKEKLERSNAVRDDLRAHIQSLPDLTKLPDVTTGGLAPLPSAGDLFTLK